MDKWETQRWLDVANTAAEERALAEDRARLREFRPESRGATGSGLRMSALMASEKPSTGPLTASDKSAEEVAR